MIEHLLRKAKKGDSDAFCRLMDMQTQSMYKIARSYLKNDEDAADAIQDTILSCYENLLSLKNNKYFQTWLTRILINKCKDILHKKKLTVYTDSIPDTPFYEDDFETTEWNQILAPLDEKYRIILLLYYNEKKLKDDLNRDIALPAVVHERINTAYRMIEEHTVKQKKKTRNPYHWMKTGAKVAGGLAAAVAVGFIFCAANPVMARELPLIGGIFEQLQDKVSFFGNFSDKATSLEESAAPTSDTEKLPETSSADETPRETVFTKTQDGLTITLSEIYANDLTCYITVKAVSEEPFPDTLMDQDGKPCISLVTEPRYSFLEDTGMNPGMQYINPEGEFTDDHTYIAILRLDTQFEDTAEFEQKYQEMVDEILAEMGITMDDINDETEEGHANLEEFNDRVLARGGALQSQYVKPIVIPETYTLNLTFKEFIGDKAEPEFWDSGYTQEELEAMSEAEFQEIMNQMPEEYSQNPNKYQNYWFKGDWSFEIPVTVDNSLTETLEINETNEEGIGLASIARTPYEITITPLYKEGSDSDCFLVALDADGNMLPYNRSSSDSYNYAIQDKNISFIDIYLLDYMQYMDELKVQYYNEELDNAEWKALLDANARYHKTVSLDK